jgi:hypothetical protein
MFTADTLTLSVLSAPSLGAGLVGPFRIEPVALLYPQ